MYKYSNFTRTAIEVACCSMYRGHINFASCSHLPKLSVLYLQSSLPSVLDFFFCGFIKIFVALMQTALPLQQWLHEHASLFRYT